MQEDMGNAELGKGWLESLDSEGYVHDTHALWSGSQSPSANNLAITLHHLRSFNQRYAMSELLISSILVGNFCVLPERTLLAS